MTEAISLPTEAHWVHLGGIDLAPDGTGCQAGSGLWEMTHRAEVLLLDIDEIETKLSKFNSATGVYAPCARTKRRALSWTQLEDGVREAQRRKR